MIFDSEHSCMSFMFWLIPCVVKKNSLQSGVDVTIRSDAVNHCYDRKDNVVRSQIRLVQTL